MITGQPPAGFVSEGRICGRFAPEVGDIVEEMDRPDLVAAQIAHAVSHNDQVAGLLIGVLREIRDREAVIREEAGLKVERGQVSRQMVNLGSNLLTMAMVPLMFAFALDVYVVVLAAIGNASLSSGAGVATVLVLAGAWFAFPVLKRRYRKSRH